MYIGQVKCHVFAQSKRPQMGSVEIALFGMSPFRYARGAIFFRAAISKGTRNAEPTRVGNRGSVLG